MATVADRVQEVRARIAAAASRAGREASEITLIAVSKKKPASMIEQAAAAGIEHIGENYVQEAIAKQDDVQAELSWHFLGHLQRNKVKNVVGRFDLIHTLDSERLAREIDKRAATEAVRVLIEVNLGGEQSKSGIPADELSSLLDLTRSLEHVEVTGLMTMPPPDEDSRPYFRQLAELAGAHDLAELSMGMTHDFETAIEEGATLVRIGTAIFGARQ